MSEQLPSDTLSRLRRYAEQNAREPWIPVKAPELLALIKCAEIVQTDYLILSDDQRMPALHALKELGL